MNDLFQLSSSYEGVLPSGVSFTVRELLTGDQSDLAKRVRQGDKKAFIKMLLACLIRVGDNTNITEKDIERMLGNDINYAFVKLRQHTFRGKESELFKFKYEFPLKPGETDKHIEFFKVNFNENLFKTEPYIWVREEMNRLEAEYKKENPEAPKYEKPYPGEFPEMYKSYPEMLEANHRRKFQFPNTEITIEWSLMDGRSEQARRQVYGLKEDFIASLYIRNAVVTRKFKESEETLAEAVEWENIPLYYSDKFREEIMRVEGQVDTIITVVSEENPNKQARVNLVQTLAFFAPSLGN